MVKPKVVLLIFVSGKIVLTGAKVRLPSPPLRSSRPAASPRSLLTRFLSRTAVPRGDLPGLRPDLPRPERVPQAVSELRLARPLRHLARLRNTSPYPRRPPLYAAYTYTPLLPHTAPIAQPSPTRAGERFTAASSCSSPARSRRPTTAHWPLPPPTRAPANLNKTRKHPRRSSLPPTPSISSSCTLSPLRDRLVLAFPHARPLGETFPSSLFRASTCCTCAPVPLLDGPVRFLAFVQRRSQEGRFEMRRTSGRSESRCDATMLAVTILSLLCRSLA